MISYLEGQILYVDTSYVVVKTHGVGYHVLLNKKALDHLCEGNDVTFFIHTHVREDAFDLYGFLSRMEKQLFMLLIGVSGVGPKLALTILSAMSPSDLLYAIVDNDIAKLSSISGIGKKTAERLALELKEKALKLEIAKSSTRMFDTSVKTNLEQAIRSLGYSKAQSDKAMMHISDEDLKTVALEELIKRSLSVLTGNITS